jgi:perosamine synthetase
VINYINYIKKIFKKKYISLSEPAISNKDIKILNGYIRNNHVSTYGVATKDLEKKISRYTGSKYVICTNNGTAALHVALAVIDVNFNDEVLMPSFSFISPANAIKYCNATPHFVDSEIDNLGVDPYKLEKYLKKNFIFNNKNLINKKNKKKVKPLILVHAYGHPAIVEDLKKICKKYNIKLIEDAAEAAGSFYKEKHVGTFGDIGVLSFNGNKIITTGGGGALLTNSKKIYKKMLSLVTLSRKENDFFDYKKVGYNYRMPSINAALGIGQIDELENFIKSRHYLHKIYKKLFKESDIKIFKEPKYCRSNYWLQVIFIKKNYAKSRRKIINFYKKNNIELRPGWKLISDIKHFKNCQKSDLSNAMYLSKHIINLPSVL